MLTGREIGRRKQPKIYVGVARVTALILPFPIEKDAVFFFFVLLVSPVLLCLVLYKMRNLIPGICHNCRNPMMLLAVDYRNFRS